MSLERQLAIEFAAIIREHVHPVVEDDAAAELDKVVDDAALVIARQVRLAAERALARPPGEWYVLRMDDGVLRREPTRKAAVAWLRRHVGGVVVGRDTLGPGDYLYYVGRNQQEDNSAAWIMRGRDAVATAGFQPDQQPLYPFVDDPHEYVERRGQS